MRVTVQTKDFFVVCSLLYKDFACKEDLLVEAVTIGLEEYYRQSGGDYFSVPYFILTKIQGKKYMVNSFISLSNAGLYKYAEALKESMVEDGLEDEIDTKIIKL
jgi:hypothetical protein